MIREAGDIVRIADAERALDVSHTAAAKLLSRWSGQGWLRRVGLGAYRCRTGLVTRRSAEDLPPFRLLTKIVREVALRQSG